MFLKHGEAICTLYLIIKLSRSFHLQTCTIPLQVSEVFSMFIPKCILSTQSIKLFPSNLNHIWHNYETLGCFLFLIYRSNWSLGFPGHSSKGRPMHPSRSKQLERMAVMASGSWRFRWAFQKELGFKNLTNIFKPKEKSLIRGLSGKQKQLEAEEMASPMQSRSQKIFSKSASIQALRWRFQTVSAVKRSCFPPPKAPPSKQQLHVYTILWTFEHVLMNLLRVRIFDPLATSQKVRRLVSAPSSNRGRPPEVGNVVASCQSRKYSTTKDHLQPPQNHLIHGTKGIKPQPKKETKRNPSRPFCWNETVSFLKRSHIFRGPKPRPMELLTPPRWGRRPTKRPKPMGTWQS